MKRYEFAHVKHETHCLYHDGDEGIPNVTL
jgi:hypothetical protein